VLPLDAILMRLSLAGLAGIVASVWLADKWAAFVALLVFYVLLVIFRKPVQVWPGQ